MFVQCSSIAPLVQSIRASKVCSLSWRLSKAKTPVSVGVLVPWTITETVSETRSTWDCEFCEFMTMNHEAGFTGRGWVKNPRRTTTTIDNGVRCHRREISWNLNINLLKQKIFAVSKSGTVWAVSRLRIGVATHKDWWCWSAASRRQLRAPGQGQPRINSHVRTPDKSRQPGNGMRKDPRPRSTPAIPTPGTGGTQGGRGQSRTKKGPPHPTHQWSRSPPVATAPKPDTSHRTGGGEGRTRHRGKWLSIVGP